MKKMYFKNELKYSKRSRHVTDVVMPLFWLLQKLSGRTLLSYKFSLPRVIKSRPSTALSLVSRLFRSCSLSPSILNAGRQLVILKCPKQPKLQK